VSAAARGLGGVAEAFESPADILRRCVRAGPCSDPCARAATLVCARLPCSDPCAPARAATRVHARPQCNHPCACVPTAQPPLYTPPLRLPPPPHPRHGNLVLANRDLHKATEKAASELNDLRANQAALLKRMRDTSLVSTSNTQAMRKQVEEARSALADLTAVREFAEADMRRDRSVAGQTEASIKNVLARVIATSPPNTFPPVEVDRTRVDHPYQFLVGALGVIGDRIRDLDAIVSEFPGWRVSWEGKGGGGRGGGGGGGVVSLCHVGKLQLRGGSCSRRCASIARRHARHPIAPAPPAARAVATLGTRSPAPPAARSAWALGTRWHTPPAARESASIVQPPSPPPPPHSPLPHLRCRNCKPASGRRPRGPRRQRLRPAQDSPQ
jgi:hypothetical protein